MSVFGGFSRSLYLHTIFVRKSAVFILTAVAPGTEHLSEKQTDSRARIHPRRKSEVSSEQGAVDGRFAPIVL